MEKLTVIISLILALSIASERLVEIVKGWVPYFSSQSENSRSENQRKSWLQALGVASGIITTFLAAPAMPDDILPSLDEGTDFFSLLALGLLASGGSGLWNSVMTYLLKLKDLKSLDVSKQQGIVDELEAKVRELESKAELLETGMGKKPN